MRFDKAFKEMVDNGETIRRECWYIGCLSFNTVTNEIEYRSNDARIWEPRYEDIIATDWLIF